MHPISGFVVVVSLCLLLAARDSALAVCGDGTLEAGEICDDGNIAPGDCCSANCLVAVTNGAPCNDGFFCTTPDRCQGGGCVGGESPCSDDSLPCTVTSCDEDTDLCRHVPNDALCDDGVFCNGKEVCDVATGAGCQPSAAPVDCAALNTACRLGLCDEDARACVTEAAGDPARCDGDGDGLSVENDGCPYTPRGARVLTQGCAAVDVVRRPHVLLGPVAAAIASAAELLRADEELASLARKLDRLAGKLGKASDGIRSGKVCKGTRGYGRVVSGFEEVRRRLSRKLVMMSEDVAADAVVKRVARGIPDDEGDYRNADAELGRLELVEDLFGDAVEHAQTTRADVDAICGAVAGNLRTSSTIESVDDAGGFIMLEDGITVAFTPGDYKTHVGPGVEVKVKGVRFDDGTGASSGRTRAKIGKKPKAELSPFACLELVVVPFQPYLGLTVDQMMTLPRAGYENLAKTKYLFEDRMWLGVVSTGNCGGSIDAGGNFVRRSLQLVVEQDGKSPKMMAADLSPGKIAPFPPGIDPSKDATLRVTARAQDCNLLAGCSSAFTQISVTSELPMRVALTGTYCTAIYETTEFALQDKDFVIGQPTQFAQFRPAKVIDIAALLLTVDPGTTPSFHAEAYKITGNGSSYPTSQAITLGDEFAIFQNHDFYSSYLLYAYESTGVNADVGLQWPHVVGIRHANPVRYACGTPVRLVRDVVNFCSVAPNSYYRLPFLIGYPIWAMGQGNNGTFTHKGAQAFAFDFVAPAGTPVHAARGGEVIKVSDDLPSSSNCYLPFTDPKCRDENNVADPDTGCTANRVQIRHQDGTVGVYVHIPMDGASVSKGSQVRRGDAIAIVGNTGCSSDPHLHFHALGGTDASQTTPSRFQTAGDTCFIPSRGDLLFSNNALD